MIVVWQEGIVATITLIAAHCFGGGLGICRRRFDERQLPG